MSLLSEVIRENRFTPEDVPRFEAKLYFFAAGQTVQHKTRSAGLALPIGFHQLRSRFRSTPFYSSLSAARS